MVFDQHSAARHADGFAQQDHGIGGVVQHIHKHDHVVMTIGARDALAVKGLHRDKCLGTYQHVQTLNTDISPTLQDGPGHATIATAHIEDSDVAGEQGGQMACEDAHTALKDQAAM
jgi:hypothetical protein